MNQSKPLIESELQAADSFDANFQTLNNKTINFLTLYCHSERSEGSWGHIG